MSYDDVCARSRGKGRAGKGAGKNGPKTEQGRGIEEKELMNGRVANETMKQIETMKGKKGGKKGSKGSKLDW